MPLSNNRFGLFGSATALHNLPTNNATLFAIDARIAAHHQKLLKEATPEVRAKLIHSFHKAKPATTENYLQQFINDFKNETVFADTIKLYEQKLNEYKQAKQLEKHEAINASLVKQKQFSEASKLTPQASEWQQLLETLKRCVSNHSTRLDLNKNFDLAELRVLWQKYEAKYGPIVLDHFSLNLAHEVAEERKQTVIDNHVEAQQNLLGNR